MALGIETGGLTAALTLAAFLTLVVNRLIEVLIRPLFDRFKWDTFWLFYVSWGVSAVLVGLTSLDVFFFVDWQWPVVGKILTALVCGGGATFLHDIFDTLNSMNDLFSNFNGDKP